MNIYSIQSGLRDSLYLL